MRLLRLNDANSTTINLDLVYKVTFNPSADDKLHIYVQPDPSTPIDISYDNSIADNGVSSDKNVVIGYNMLMIALGFPSLCIPPTANLVITSISPGGGPAGGGTVVTITGSGFIQQPMFVWLHNGASDFVCLYVTYISPTQLQFTVPVVTGTLTYDVKVSYVNELSTNYYQILTGAYVVP